MDALAANATEIIVVITFIIALFGLYALLVRVKDAQIDSLKDEVERLNRQGSDPYEIGAVIPLLKEEHELVVRKINEANVEKSGEVNSLTKSLEEKEKVISELLQESEVIKQTNKSLKDRITIILEDYEPIRGGFGKDITTGETGIPVRYGKRDVYL